MRSSTLTSNHSNFPKVLANMGSEYDDAAVQVSENGFYVAVSFLHVQPPTVFFAFLLSIMCSHIVKQCH